jgi:hypothetical protein
LENGVFLKSYLLRLLRCFIELEAALSLSTGAPIGKDYSAPFCIMGLDNFTQGIICAHFADMLAVHNKSKHVMDKRCASEASTKFSLVIGRSDIKFYDGHKNFLQCKTETKRIWRAERARKLFSDLVITCSENV